MASTVELPEPIKGKLSKVIYILDDAGKRIEEECEIFKNKTSTKSPTSSTIINNHNLNNKQPKNVYIPLDLIEAMSDISALKSVLSCPIFNRIVNVTDSLDKISYYLNLHPSIGPTDINIDSNGDLVVAPSIEPTSLNNLINSKLDQYSEHSNGSVQIVSPNRVVQQQQQHLQQNNNINQAPILINDHHNLQTQQQQQQQQQMIFNQTSNGPTITDQIIVVKQINEQYTSPIPQQSLKQNLSSPYSHQQHITSNNNQETTSQNFIPPGGTAALISSFNSYDTEKLVSNGSNKTYESSNKQNNRQCSNNNDSPSRLNTANGQYKLDQIVPVRNNSSDNNLDINNINTNKQFSINNDQSSKSGYTNELYRATQDMKQNCSIATNNQQQRPSVSEGKQNTYLANVNKHNLQTNVPNSGNGLYNRGSCSPSTSAGSTVKLADDCDSGASSYQSHITTEPASMNNIKSLPAYSSNKNNNYSYKSDENVITSSNGKTNIPINTTPNHDQIDCSIEQQSNVNEMTKNNNKNKSAESKMERIKVTLQKDSDGLGITVAGYTIEDEDISGIFIRSITHGGPADRSGKVKEYDQILSVNGKEILSYNNRDSVHELKHAGDVVTLELMRFLAESKNYKKLKSALGKAQPNFRPKTDFSEIPNSNSASSFHLPIVSPLKSSIPVIKSRDNNNSSPVKSPTSPIANIMQKSNNAQVSTYNNNNNISNNDGIHSGTKKESIYKNESVYANSKTIVVSAYKSSLDSNSQEVNNQSNIPIAAQRGSNKVIETKQGARNTIDIKSPLCQTTNTATYVNKFGELDFNDSTTLNKEITKKSVTARLQSEASDEFNKLMRLDEPEWEEKTQIIEIVRDSTQGLGFTVKDYINPKDQKQLIIMITSITPGGIASRDGRLEIGDLLIFVDDTNLKGASLEDAVKALKRTNGPVRLGVLKLKRINN